MPNITRRSILTSIATSAIAATLEHNAQAKTVRLTPVQVARTLLKVANQVSNSQLDKQTRDKLAEILESMSAQVQEKYNTGPLCDTDTACEKLVGGQS
jgi:hypothetical protein